MVMSTSNTKSFIHKEQYGGKKKMKHPMKKSAPMKKKTPAKKPMKKKKGY